MIRLHFPTVSKLSSMLFLLIMLVVAPIRARAAHWKPVPGHLTTPWTKLVNPEHVLTKYPRPQFVRSHWMNLNGLWEYDTNSSGPLPFGKRLPGRILVPFPIESSLSGVMKHSANIIYRRTFVLPNGWIGKQVLLHFGAVDWKATVFVNGKKVGSHEGGYDPFTFDITSELSRGRKQELIVRVFDPTDDGIQPTGKQSLHPGGIYYTPVTGIWQTVWLEPVNRVHIRRIRLIPDIDDSTLCVSASVSGNCEGCRLEGEVFVGKRLLTSAVGYPDTTFSIPIKGERLWSPSDPFLYGLSLTLMRHGTVLDRIRSYFGMRKISIGKGIKGTTRILLNNKFVFLDGPLFQGYWPDGLYTAPTDQALRFDVETIKRLGFNMVRVHQVVEPQGWYYWCDRLGVVVFQDMPGPHRADNYKARETRLSDKEFKTELRRMVQTHCNHPSIVMWILFNEGWGQHDTRSLAAFVKRLDPSRLLDDASGWTDRGVGNVIDIHRYPGPASPRPEGDRAAVLGEFGGLALPAQGHLWEQKHWGYRVMRDSSELLERYRLLFDKVWILEADSGLSAAVYTQLTDVESEVNGLMTYDRRVLKINQEKAFLIDRGKDLGPMKKILGRSIAR